FLGFDQIDVNNVQRDGKGKVVKNGAGELTVTGATGQWTNRTGVEIDAGSIKLANNDVLGSATTTGTLTFADAAGANLNLDGHTQTVRGIVGGGASGGNVLLGSGGTLTMSFPNVTLTYSGVIGGTGGVVKLGSGTQEFGGANNYTGGTTITTGAI